MNITIVVREDLSSTGTLDDGRVCTMGPMNPVTHVPFVDADEITAFLNGHATTRQDVYFVTPAAPVSPVYTLTSLIDKMNEVVAGAGDDVMDEMLDAIEAGDKIMRRIEKRFSWADEIDVLHTATQDAFDYLQAIPTVPSFTATVRAGVES
jgi:hypothetical protein